VLWSSGRGSRSECGKRSWDTSVGRNKVPPFVPDLSIIRDPIAQICDIDYIY
jgi:hypothetical protein